MEKGGNWDQKKRQAQHRGDLDARVLKKPTKPKDLIRERGRGTGKGGGDGRQQKHTWRLAASELLSSEELGGAVQCSAAVVAASSSRPAPYLPLLLLLLLGFGYFSASPRCY